MWLHCSVHERDIPSLHGRELLKNSRMTALYERAKGGGHGQNMTTQKEEEGREEEMRSYWILLFHDSTQSTVQVQTFFFAPLFRQSNVQNGEKLDWSIWTTFWPVAAVENWQIKLILQHCISASHSHTLKKYFWSWCVPKKNPTTISSFFKVFFIVTFGSDIKVRRPNSDGHKKPKVVWWSRSNWICRIGFIGFVRNSQWHSDFRVKVLLGILSVWK